MTGGGRRLAILSRMFLVLILSWGLPALGQAQQQGLSEMTVEHYAFAKEGQEKTYEYVVRKNNAEHEVLAEKNEVLAQRTLDGKLVTPVKITVSSKKSKEIPIRIVVRFFTVEPDAWTLVASQGIGDWKPRKTEDILLKGPLQIGTRWGSGRMEKIIEAIDETVEVAGKTFPKCVKLKAVDQREGEIFSEEIRWLAPGWGTVKFHYEMKKTNTQIVGQVVFYQD